MGFFFIFSSLLAIIYIYTGFRLIPSILKGRNTLLAWIGLAGFWTSLVCHIYFRVSDIYPGLSHILAWNGYAGLGLITYLFCLAFGRDLLIILIAAASKIKAIASPKKRGILPDLGRRQFLFKTSSYGIALAGATVTGVGTGMALQPPQVVRITIALPQKAKGLKGLTIAQITDLHVGPTIGYDYVRQVCDTVTGLNADIIAITGDLVDGSPQALDHALSPLKKLNAPFGKYFVTGNHEYYSGAEQWIQQVNIWGYDTLLNEHRVIQYQTGLLTLAGVTDIRAGSFFPNHLSSPQKALKGAPDNSYKLLLAHQPTSVFKAAGQGVDLQLSGHTHGGQFFPFGYVVGMIHPFVKGMYRHEQTKLYVSQGTGYWGPPVRLGTFPEITLFTFI